MVPQFNRVVTLDVQIRVVEIQEIFKVDWNGFHQALLDDYMLDDLTRVTKKAFL